MTPNNQQVDGSSSGLHRNNKKLAVIMTVLVAILLIVAAVYVFIAAQNNTEETTNTPVSSQPDNTREDEITPATSGDIDDAIQSSDEMSNNLNDTDLTEESISDEALGVQ
jgi:flagellar basal body-associated protein FliL